MEAFFGLVFVVAVAWILIARFSRIKEAKTRREEEDGRLEVLSHAKRIINDHVATLYRKKLQKTKHDDYGNSFDKDWLKEKEYFYNSVTVPQLLKRFSQDDIASYREDIDAVLIEKAVKNYAESVSIEEINIDRLTPVEFEAHCASILLRAGWVARVTRASGDQGIDIIAEKNGRKVVFQVKKSSSPVGNKAVQEAIAGKSYVSANKAYVVSNANFTNSAKELANISGVGLLHYTELQSLES